MVQWVKKDPEGCNSGSDLIPDLGTPHASGRERKKRGEGGREASCHHVWIEGANIQHQQKLIRTNERAVRFNGCKISWGK